MGAQMTRTIGTHTFATAAEARAFQASQWTEAQFQSQVMAVARRLGWRVYHTHDSRRSARGFPDLCMVRDRVVFAELKRAKGGRVSEEQREWLTALNAAGTEAYLWRPQDLLDDTITRTLQRRDDR